MRRRASAAWSSGMAVRAGYIARAWASARPLDRKSTRLNSSHGHTSYADFCLKEKYGIKSAIQGSNVPNPDEAVPSFVSGAMAKAGKGLLEGTLQSGASAVSDKLLDLVGLGGK